MKIEQHLSHSIKSKLPPATSPNQEDFVCKVPSRLTILGQAIEPVAKKLREAITHRIKSSNCVFVIPDDLARHMGIIQQALTRLQPRVDALMSNVVNDENAGIAEVYREAGRVEQVLSEFVDGYQDAKASCTTVETRVGRDLLLGVYRHHIREVCEWLEELVEVIADPLAAIEKQAVPMSENVELSVALRMTSPPEMAKLDELAKRLLAEPTIELTRPHSCPPKESRDPGALDAIGALAFGVGITNALFKRHRH